MSITIDNIEIIENDHNKQKHKKVSYFNPKSNVYLMVS